MTLPKPGALGLPEEFGSWRPMQEDALEYLSRSTKRVKALCAPTGSGKSAIYVGDALRPENKNRPTCFVTDSRALQDQLNRTFNSIGMVDLRGRANYTCLMRNGEMTCEQGYASRCPYKGTYDCPASKAEYDAAASPLVVTNYDKLIHSRRYGHGLSHVQRLVFDEGHEAANALARAMQVTLHEREMVERLKVPFPPQDEALFFSAWKPWAALARAVCLEAMRKAQQKIQVTDPKPSWVKDFTHLRNLHRRLSILSTANIDNWVVEEVHKGYQFDPINVSRYAEYALLTKVPDITVVSATMRPKTLYLMGVGREHYDFKEFLSDFDPKRCPVYHIPTQRVDKRADDYSLLWMRLDQIAARRRDRNGIVHTVSFARRDEILKASRFADSMIVNERGEPPTEMVELFKRSYPGAILVSPSVGQGFDFKGKAAEWQFICKIPFPPPSKVLKARTEQDPEYPHYLAMQKLVQAVGRIMRDKTDQGETFLGDDHLDWFLPRYSHLKPKWFDMFFQRVDVLPQPPPRL